MHFEIKQISIEINTWYIFKHKLNIWYAGLVWNEHI